VQRSFVGSRSGAAPLPQDDNLICYQSNLVGNSVGAQNGGLNWTGPQNRKLIYPPGSGSMIDRRVDHLTRKRVAEMSPEEMRVALLVSEKTGGPNPRAFDEGRQSQFVAMSDVNGLKAMNEQFSYSAGDILIRRFAEVLTSVGLDAYHDKGDEFLCKGESYQELNLKLAEAQRRLREQPFVVCGLDDRIATIEGADFCFGIGTNLEEAESSLRHQKELQKLAEEGDSAVTVG